MSWRVSLPEDIGDELVAEGVASRPRPTRGATSETVSLLIDSINSGAAVVSIAGGIAACGRLAAKMLLRRKASDPDIVEFTAIDGNGNRSTIKINRVDPNAQDQLLDFLLAALVLKDPQEEQQP